MDAILGHGGSLSRFRASTARTIARAIARLTTHSIPNQTGAVDSISSRSESARASARQGFALSLARLLGLDPSQRRAGSRRIGDEDRGMPDFYGDRSLADLATRRETFELYKILAGHDNLV
jgi:hypothetical protein